MAGDQHGLGPRDHATFEKITVLHLGSKPLSAAESITGKKAAFLTTVYEELL